MSPSDVSSHLSSIEKNGWMIYLISFQNDLGTLKITDYKVQYRSAKTSIVRDIIQC